MNKWYIVGVSYATIVFYGVAYLNSRINIVDWMGSKSWWHMPVGLTLLFGFIETWAIVMTNATITQSDS